MNSSIDDLLNLLPEDRYLLALAAEYMESSDESCSELSRLQYCLPRALTLAEEVRFVLWWYRIFLFVNNLNCRSGLYYWQSARFRFHPLERHQREIEFYRSDATFSQKRWILEFCSCLVVHQPQ